MLTGSTETSHEYEELDNPVNAYLHEVVPGKLIAMLGPMDIADGQQWSDTHHADGAFGHRDFSPTH